MFQVNNKKTRTTSKFIVNLMILLLTLKIFYTVFQCFYFEQVNVSWVGCSCGDNLQIKQFDQTIRRRLQKTSQVRKLIFLYRLLPGARSVAETNNKKLGVTLRINKFIMKI